MFLRAFGRRIAQPVMPDDEAFGYLPTQIVADYLAQRPTPAIDGILFRSTQTGGKGRNVVLFNRASRVEPDVSAKPIQPRGFELSLLDDILGDAPAPVEPDPFPIDVDIDDDRLATLRIDPDSIQISDVRAVSYIEKRQSVAFWQLDLEEREREYD